MHSVWIMSLLKKMNFARIYIILINMLQPRVKNDMRWLIYNSYYQKLAFKKMLEFEQF